MTAALLMLVSALRRIDLMKVAYGLRSRAAVNLLLLERVAAPFALVSGGSRIGTLQTAFWYEGVVPAVALSPADAA